ncbi:MAG: hypothetical protein N3E37_01790 [Candidatus Micrarchaeota archaeon]|nr:hypothetical protein [Candidatus Micrarchaeota archaeon]
MEFLNKIKISELELSIILVFSMLLLGVIMFPLNLQEELKIHKNSAVSKEISEKWKSINGKYTYTVVIEDPSKELFNSQEYMNLLNLNKEEKLFLVKNDTLVAFSVEYEAYPAKTCLNVFEYYLEEKKEYCLDYSFENYYEYPSFFINYMMLALAENISAESRVSYLNHTITIKNNLSNVNEIAFENISFYNIKSEMWNFILDKSTGIPIAGFSSASTFKLEYYLIHTNDPRLEHLNDIILANQNIIILKLNSSMKYSK